MAFEFQPIVGHSGISDAPNLLLQAIRTRHAREQLDMQKSAEEARIQREAKQFELQQQAQLRQERRLELEQERQRKADERQRRMENVAAIKEATKLNRAGAGLEAQRILKAYQIEADPLDEQGQPIQPEQPTQPQGGSPVPDAVEFPEPNEPPGMFERAKQAVSGAVAPIVGRAAAPAPEPQAEAPAPTMPRPNPLIAARQPAKWRLRGTGGEDLGIMDPMEEVRANATKADQFKAGFGGVEMLQPYLPAGIAAIQQGADPQHVYDTLLKQASEDASRRAKEQESSIDRAAAEKRARIMSTGLAARARENIDLKIDALNDQDLNTLDRRVSSWRQETGFSKIREQEQALRGAIKNVTSNMGLQERDAMVQMGKFFRGATPTEAEMALLYHNLGGTENALQKFLYNSIKGKLSPEEVRQLKASAETARHELQETSQRAYKSFRARLGPGSGFDRAAGNINAIAQAEFEILGMHDMPPIWPGMPDETNTIRMGSGERPNRLQKAAKAAAAKKPTAKKAEDDDF